MDFKLNNTNSSLNIENNKSASKKSASKLKNKSSNSGNKKSTPLHSKNSKKQKISITNKNIDTQDITTLKKTEKKVQSVEKKEFKINNTTLFFDNYVYVDCSNGSDESANGDFYIPFATIKRAMDYLNDNVNSGEKCAIILKRGSYDISDALDKEYKNFNQEYSDMDISFIAMPSHRGNVLISSSIGFEPSVKENKISLTFNGIIFKNIKGRGMTLNNDNSPNKYYNCVFDNIAVGGYSSLHYDASVSIVNCLFVNTTERDSKYRVSGKCLNSATTNDHIQPLDGENSRILYNCSVDDKYNITSLEWEHSGIGKNPDDSSANIGVYGGEFAWFTEDEIKLFEFKINNYSLFFKKFVYIDSSYGNDEKGDGDFSNPFKTTKRAMDYLNNNEDFRSNCAIIFKCGSYDISDILTEDDLDCKYSNMNISWIADIGHQGKVFINSEKGFNPSIEDGNIKFNFYGLIFKDISGRGFTLNSDKDINEYYNCVFDNISINTPCKNNNAYVVVRNCLFVNTNNVNSDFKASGKCINCASTNKNVQPLSEVPVKIIYDCSIDNLYNVVSYGSEHTGIGNNPDDSSANIGVYGGQFAWKVPKYNNSEFKINDTSLMFNKLVYIDSSYGNDEEGDGDFSKPFKTVKKAMDYLNINRIFREKCAVIFKKGSYDISDCVNTENGTLNAEYSGMNISWIADIGYQGKVFINSHYGFKTTVVSNNNSNNSIEMKFYGLVFKNIENCGMTLNGDTGLNEYYNCVFENIAIGGSNEFVKDSYTKVYNCLFVNTVEQNSEFNLYGQCINSVTTNDHIEPENGEMLNVLYNCYVDCNYYSITSRGWINTGIGNNPDNSQANLGVYGGPFTWR